MRRFLTTFAVTAAIAGGTFLGAGGFQAAPDTLDRTQTVGSITVNIGEMRQQVADLRRKAAQLDRLGERDAARKARAQADALQRRIDAIIAAEENN
ncbi:hypothetical protein [Streptomyces purpureus]|uniref:Secreted protein n=1 Tax=Streptomyces purpureus TaxID=1951 RepID=A0A918GW19_9ACTN|nr:hypothetical protein [Streptomyces purpureus]GGT11871.1 hypothetical protein GCM10014713_00300 [Streptomyces purpureus]